MKGSQMNLRNLKQSVAVVVALILSFACVPGAMAQTPVNSAASVINLTVTINSSVTLSCTPSAITFTASGGGAVINANVPISCTVNWTLASGIQSNLTVYQWFTSNTPLGSGAPGVAANFFWSQVDGGAFTAFASTSTTPGGTGTAMPAGYYGPNLYSVALTGANTSGTHTDTTLLQLTGANTIPAGNYTSTLNIEAQAL
jgi:hypothetical protein